MQPGLKGRNGSGSRVELGLKKLGKQYKVIAGFGNRVVVFITRITPGRQLIKIGAKVIPEKLEILNYKHGIPDDTETWKTSFIEFETHKPKD